MSKRLIIIIFLLGILLIELLSTGVIYNYAYKVGYNDGVDKMVMTIDSIFTKRTKNLTNGMEK